MKRTERLFAMAAYLRGRRTGVTAEQIAERFEVTVRTVYRDLDSLRAGELPVHADRGPGGGYALDRSYALPPVNFTAEEAAALVLGAELLLEMRLTPLGETTKRGVDKVRAALPRESLRELDLRRASLSFVGVPAQVCSREVSKLIEQAWLSRRPLTIRYEGAKATSTRTIRITGIVIDRRETMINALDLELNESRQFLLHRIVSASIAPS